MVYKKDYMNSLGRFNPVSVVMNLLSGRWRYPEQLSCSTNLTHAQAQRLEDMVRQEQQRRPLAGMERFNRDSRDRHARICTECDATFTIVRYPESNLEDFCPSCAFRLRTNENKLRRSCKLDPYGE